MNEESANRVLKIFAEAQKKKYMPCPRCGYATMDPVVTRNALSRHADIYVCSACGTDEAIRDFVGKTIPITEWIGLKDAE